MHAPFEPTISADKRHLTFVILSRGEPVTCVVSRATLEAYFWLAPNANDAWTLKVFIDGFRRIRAIAERKLLTRPSKQIELSAADFAKGSARRSRPSAGRAVGGAIKWDTGRRRLVALLMRTVSSSDCGASLASNVG
ncbi:DUF1488 family protein [Caballeronia sp. GaOx3]|uniref:DUF1488 family protein n=1 Tax=Caballeronia sp. GaOx3 TaxID=2921740 RepID=UPI002029541B|nr:DUF1488 family protein [Caballeronia sp. GaOx3]